MNRERFNLVLDIARSISPHNFLPNVWNYCVIGHAARDPRVQADGFHVDAWPSYRNYSDYTAIGRYLDISPKDAFDLFHSRAGEGPADYVARMEAYYAQEGEIRAALRSVSEISDDCIEENL